MFDPRARYFRNLRRLRRAARRWTVLAGMFTGAAAVLVPYAGLGVADAFWAAAAGGSAAWAAWRWRDAKAVAAQPPPEPVDPAAATRAKLVSAAERLFGRTTVDHIRRQAVRTRLRGSAAAPAYDRLDRAATSLAGLTTRLGDLAGPAATDAAAAESGLRDLAQRVAAIEHAIGVSPAGSREGLTAARDDLTRQLTEGVEAYEHLVAAAAEYVAADSHAPGTPAVARLTEATETVQSFAYGLSEAKTISFPTL